MSKQETSTAFVRPVRMLVSVPCRKLDQTIETVQGKSDSVQKLYQDYVLGKLDPSQIGGSPVYDPEGSDEVDAFNHFGVTLEDVTQIAEAGAQASRDVREHKMRQEAARRQQREQSASTNTPTPPKEDSTPTP